MQAQNQQLVMLHLASKRPSMSRRSHIVYRNVLLNTHVLSLLSLFFLVNWELNWVWSPLSWMCPKKVRDVSRKRLHGNNFCPPPKKTYVFAHVNVVITQNSAQRRSLCWLRRSTRYRSKSRVRLERSSPLLKRNVCSIRNLGMTSDIISESQTLKRHWLIFKHFIIQWCSSFFFSKVKTLADDDPWLDDTAAWVEKSRKLAKEKEMAEKRVRRRTCHLLIVYGFALQLAVIALNLL